MTDSISETPENLCKVGVFTFLRPSKGAWIFGLGLIAMCLGLGIWQLQRLEWKQGLIDDLLFANESSAILVTKLPEDLKDLDEKVFHNVSIPGYFDFEHEFHVIGYRHNGMPGYGIFTPFRVEDHGGTIIVNRGWVPNERKEPEDRVEDPRFDGLVWLTGRILSPSEARWYMPANDPEKNVWLTPDLEAMSKMVGKDLPSVYIEMINKNPPPKTLPIPRSEMNITLRNDHYGYALTWFALAFAGLCIFFIRHLHSMEGDEEADEGEKK